MRVRKLALAVGLVSALGGNAALALGLGEVKLNSALNQPLNAEISLLQTRGLGEGEIKVRLANPEDFERAGVDRSYLLTELRFDVDYSGREPVIRISSRGPIREPFLNFLVETRWPSGRLLREYTLLMDLPAFSNTAASQPVRAAERERQQVQRQAPAPQPAPRPQPVVPAQPEPVSQPEPVVEEQPAQPEPRQEPVAEEPVELRNEAATPAAEQSRVYGPVSANETLWEIALENRTSGEFSVHQNMLAIQRLNPEAFIGDNINLLKKGAVLRLPNAEQVRQLTLSEAVAEVASQNESWRQRSGVPEATGAPLDARAATEDRSASDTVEGRVSLAAPGDNESVQSGSGSGAGESEALEGELAVTEEELDKSRLENEELQERISELDEQIDTMERLVEVSNEELRAVQDASSQAEPSADPLAIADEAESVDAAAGEEAGELTDEGGTTDVAAAAEEPAEADSAADQRNRVVVQTQSEPTLVDRLMENIQLIGIGIGGLLIAIAGFISWRRRKEEEEAMRRVEAEMAAERSLADAPSETESEGEFAVGHSAEMEDSFDLGELDDIGTDDPVSEAEIHLSLGQYGEAESKLIAGLDKSPQNVDARLMLLEVYAHQQDAGKFDEHYHKLLEVSDGPAADRAARLRESIAGAEPFEAPSSMDFSSESLEAAQLDDISASFDDDFSADNSAGQEDAGLLDDLSADFSSDSASGFESEYSSQSGDKLEDDFSLDLGSDFNIDSDLESQDEASDTPAESESDDFNLDDLVSADLELDSLDLELENDSEVTPEAQAGGSEAGDDFGSLDLDLDLDTGPAQAEGPEQPAERDGGLDFDLDLTPVEDSDAGPSEAAATDSQEDFDSDAFEDFSDQGGELDLDSVDLDDISGDLDQAQPSAESQPEEISEAAGAGAETQAAASGSEADFEDLGFDLEGDLDSELNLLDGSDEVGTKLELAQAYMDMGDRDGARDILNEVVEEGQGEHCDRAREMLERMS